jgi:hypothetical protein
MILVTLFVLLKSDLVVLLMSDLGGVKVNQCIRFLLNVSGFPLSAPPPAGSTHLSLTGSGNPQTFGRKRIR